MLPAVVTSSENLSLDCVDDESAEKEVEDCGALNACHSHRSNKEYEFNQFFISAETSSYQDNGSEIIELGYVHGVQPPTPRDCETFHGILESDDVVILPSARAHLELPTSHIDREDGDGADAFSESDVEVDDNDDTFANTLSLDADRSDKAILKNAAIADARAFLEDIKQHSDARSKLLEEVSSFTSDEVYAETEQLKSELELIEKLDTKLQELESAEPSTCSSRPTLSAERCKSLPTAVVYLRDENKRRKRQLLLKKALQKLDMVESRNASKHVLRNIQLGPRARYFLLTKEEEDIVEDLLSRPDFLDDETSEGNSTTSSISTAFDLEGDDALRMAEIDEKLEQFIEIHSQCGSPSLTSEY